jgi:YVTN family beta-propeller protein
MKRLMMALLATTAFTVPLLAHAAGPKAYIGEFKDNSITVLDTGTNKVLKAIPVPTGPHGVVIAPDGRHVYVSSDGATTVSIIDTTSDQVVQTIEVGKAPHGLALTPDGRRLLVGVFGTNQLAVIDTTNNSVIGQVPVPNPHNIAIQPGKMIAYVASQAPGKAGLAVVDLTHMSLVGTVPFDKVPRALNFSPDGKLLYFTQAGVDAVQVLNTDSNKVIGQIPVGASPHHVVFAPSGNLALVVSQGPGTLVGIDPARNAVVYAIPVGKQPHWIALTASGRSAYVTNESSNTVSIVDLGTRRVSATIPVGNGPRKIDIQPSGKTDSQKAGSVFGNLHVVAQKTTTVSIKGFSFMPPRTTIAGGQSVTWNNDDTVTHAVTGAKGEWSSGDLSPGARFSHVFSKPGTYDYACSIHPYMHGQVIVQ